MDSVDIWGSVFPNRIPRSDLFFWAYENRVWSPYASYEPYLIHTRATSIRIPTRFGSAQARIRDRTRRPVCRSPTRHEDWRAREAAAPASYSTSSTSVSRTVCARTTRSDRKLLSAIKVNYVRTLQYTNNEGACRSILRRRS